MVLHALVFLACLTPSVIVGLTGIGRPYDAIPDQDLLWASEALRLIRGVAPSYADHPGAFWTLLYQFNILIAESLGGGNILNALGQITPTGIQSVIQTARVENAALSGLCAYLVFPASRCLHISRATAVAIAVTTAFSSAILVGVSEIRHETISMAFLLLYVATFLSALRRPKGSKSRIALTILSVILFFSAGFCKNQALLLSPLVFASTLGIAYKDNQAVIKPWADTAHARPYQSILAPLAASSLPWLISASPDIDLINLPFWITINTGLTCSISIGFFNKLTQRYFYQSLTLLGIFEIVLFKIFIPQWWRQAITGFPSWMFRYAHTVEDRSIGLLEQTTRGIETYFPHLFTPSGIAFIAFSVLLALSALSPIRHFSALTRGSQQARSTATVNPPSISWAWPLCWLSLIASSQRAAPRYEIYILIPILMAAAATLSRHRKLYEPQKRDAIALIATTCSALLISTAALRSVANAQNLNSFINAGQARDSLCIGHHMDRTMQLTSAGKCKVFQQGARDKDVYDSWNGPR